MAQEIVEEQRERTRSTKGSISEKGANQSETGDVTHSSFEMTSKMTSEQEVDTETRKNKQDNEDIYSASSKLKQICSNHASSTQKPILESQERKTNYQEMKSSEENDDFTFTFSKKLIALAREKQVENKIKRRWESKRFSRKRIASGNPGSHGHSVLKRRRRRLNQSLSTYEENEDSNSLENVSDYEDKPMEERSQREGKTKLRRTDVFKTTLMDHEFSRRLTELSRKNQRYQSQEHAHCCRCVQSFECFWPRSNLQIIRRQAFC